MDLLETTLKVIENRNNAQENLTSFKQDLVKYEDYIGQLKDNLQDAQSASSRNTEILEINNLTKNAFNENSKEAKVLFGLIYEYVQQIDQNLKAITQTENPLEELSNENAERLKNLEENFVKALKTLEIINENVNAKIVDEESELQKKINAVDNTEIAASDELWKSVTDLHEEKHKTLYSIKLNVEILESNIESDLRQQEAVIQVKREDTQKQLEEIQNNFEMKDKIMLVEEGMLILSQKLKEILARKGELMQKQNESRQTLQRLEKEYSNLEIELNRSKTNKKKYLADLTSEIELKQILIKENEAKLSSCQNSTTEMNNEIKQISEKLLNLDQELVLLHQSADKGDEFLKQNHLDKIMETHSKLMKNSEKLLNMIADTEDKIKQKKSEVEDLKVASNVEKCELEQNMNNLNLKSDKKIEAEKVEVEKAESRNKNLRQSVEQQQKAIKDLTAKKEHLELEYAKKEKELENLTKKCKDIEEEIQRLEKTKKDKMYKIFPKPSVKHALPVNQNKQLKKRPRTIDCGSDSSLDGERLSYSEFMAKKKLLREKKQKRTAN